MSRTQGPAKAPSPAYSSLGEFLDATKGMERHEGYRKAMAEYASLREWIEATSAAQQNGRPTETEHWVEYFSGIRKMLVYLDAQPVYSSDAKLMALIQEAGTRWGRIGKQSP